MKKSFAPLHLNPQPSLKILKSERTRTVILNTALDFIWSHPFREMTVNSLMSTTGASRSTFYQYFKDLHGVMEALLKLLKDEVYAVTGPWFTGVGDPVVLLHESLDGLVDVCYRLGPIVRAVEEATSTDEKLETAWRQFVSEFDDAVTARIEADQQQGLIQNFDARPVAIALNRLDVYVLIEAFGQHPKSERASVHKALARIWISTLYGSEWIGNESSNLVRK